MTTEQLDDAVEEHPKYRRAMEWLEIASKATTNATEIIERQQAEIQRLQAQLHNVRREVM